MTISFRKVLAGVAALILLSAVISGRMIFETLWLIAFGFISFLRSNLVRMTFNPDTWVPGLLAFGLILLILHLALRSLAARRLRPWKIRSTLAVGLLLPALFGTSFLIPGTILHLRELTRLL